MPKTATERARDRALEQVRLREEGVELQGEYRNVSDHVSWEDPNGDPTDRQAARLNTLSKKAQDLEVAFQRRAAEIAADERLSEEGVRQRVAETAREFLEGEHEASSGGTLSWAEREVKKRAQKVLQERQEMTPYEPADPTDARSAVREGQLRRHLRENVGDDDRLRVVEQWIQGDDPVRRRAVLTAEPEEIGIAPAHMSRLRDQALEARYGERVGELQAVATAAEIANNNLRQVRQILERAATLGK